MMKEKIFIGRENRETERFRQCRSLRTYSKAQRQLYEEERGNISLSQQQEAKNTYQEMQGCNEKHDMEKEDEESC